MFIRLEDIISEINSENNTKNEPKTQLIVNQFNNILYKKLLDGNKIKLPIGVLSIKKRKTNNVFHENAGFTYKIYVETNKEFRDTLIKNELEK